MEHHSLEVLPLKNKNQVQQTNKSKNQQSRTNNNITDENSKNIQMASAREGYSKSRTELINVLAFVQQKKYIVEVLSIYNRQLKLTLDIILTHNFF